MTTAPTGAFHKTGLLMTGRELALLLRTLPDEIEQTPTGDWRLDVPGVWRFWGYVSDEDVNDEVAA
jgi:hypothetical protein